MKDLLKLTWPLHLFTDPGQSNMATDCMYCIVRV